TAERLGFGTEIDQLLVKMEYRGSPGEAVAFGNHLAEKLAVARSRPVRVEVLAATHPHALLMSAMLRVLGVLAALAFGASAALASYLVSAWMRREVRSVGILKTLGARGSQVAAQYLALVVPLVVASLAAAAPLGFALASALVRHEANVINIDIGSMAVPG